MHLHFSIARRFFVVIVTGESVTLLLPASNVNCVVFKHVKMKSASSEDNF